MPQPNNQHSSENPVGKFMVAVGAVIEHQQTGKILIVQRAKNLDWHPGDWEMIYGRLDQFEDPLLGLQREVLEEVGISDLQVHEPLTVWHIQRGTEKKAENDLIGITFRCTTNTKTVKLSSEHSSYKWVTPKEALACITVAGIRRDIEKWNSTYATTLHQ